MNVTTAGLKDQVKNKNKKQQKILLIWQIAKDSR